MAKKNDLAANWLLPAVPKLAASWPATWPSSFSQGNMDLWRKNDLAATGP